MNSDMIFLNWSKSLKSFFLKLRMIHGPLGQGEYPNMALCTTNFEKGQNKNKSPRRGIE